MKTLIRTLCVALLAAPLLQACSGNAESDDIVDIGKSCNAASDCEHFCTVERGQAMGQCSIECETNRDCPSFMQCITGSSTGERRCFDPGGLVVAPLERFCLYACGDVNYFCSTAAISDADVAACDAWCDEAPDDELQQFIDCVNMSDRYESACPATECMAITRS
jgi:hypothetical protein